MLFRKSQFETKQKKDNQYIITPAEREKFCAFVSQSLGLVLRNENEVRERARENYLSILLPEYAMKSLFRAREKLTHRYSRK